MSNNELNELIGDICEIRSLADEMVACLKKKDFEGAYSLGAELSYADIIGTEDKIQKLIENNAS
jgi:hypothetical protein